jgi:tRNA threonylcarbamoyladenosine biosynthesis protein TsaB
MRVLALDTATEACSVAVLTEEGIFGVCREVGRGHAEQILGMVEATLCEAGVRLAQLDTLVASVGPGAFTGVRICVSVAQGLAFGAELPVVAVTTLEALALQALKLKTTQQGNEVLVCLDARMDEVYWGCFSGDPDHGLIARSVAAVGPATSVSVPFNGGFCGIGRGFAAYPVLATLPGVSLAPGSDKALPDARDMVALGAIRFKLGAAVDPADLAPLYLRNKVALTESERAAAKLK